MEAHSFNPSTWETEEGESLSSGQPALKSEFQDNQGYQKKAYLEKKKIGFHAIACYNCHLF